MADADKEAVYDAKIAPLVTQLMEVCRAEGVPFFATFQYDDASFCTSAHSTGGHPVFGHLFVMGRCAESGGVNVDKYLMWLAREAREKGHSSAMLSLMGVPLQPPAESPQ